jgi:hypothetical protein
MLPVGHSPYATLRRNAKFARVHRERRGEARREASIVQLPTPPCRRIQRAQRMSWSVDNPTTRTAVARESPRFNKLAECYENRNAQRKRPSPAILASQEETRATAPALDSPNHDAPAGQKPRAERPDQPYDRKLQALKIQKETRDERNECETHPHSTARTNEQHDQVHARTHRARQTQKAQRYTRCRASSAADESDRAQRSSSTAPELTGPG